MGKLGIDWSRGVEVTVPVTGGGGNNQAWPLCWPLVSSKIGGRRLCFDLACWIGCGSAGRRRRSVRAGEGVGASGSSVPALGGATKLGQSLSPPSRLVSGGVGAVRLQVGCCVLKVQ